MYLYDTNTCDLSDNKTDIDEHTRYNDDMTNSYNELIEDICKLKRIKECILDYECKL